MGEGKQVVENISAPVPQWAWRKDPWVAKVTKGKFTNFTFVEFGQEETTYVTKYISDELSELAEAGKRDVLNEKYDAMSSCFYTNTPKERSGVESYFNSLGRFGEMSAEEEEKKKAKEIAKMEFTTGEYVTEFEGSTIFFVRKEVPGSRYSGLYVGFVEGRNNQKVMRTFVKHLIKKYRKETPTEFIEIWNCQYGAWSPDMTTKGRPKESVILPKKFKDNLMADINEFLSDDTKQWFFDKGIPYKRSYLFYGVPGSGKTSLISAIATEKKKPVCYLSPSGPEMTDDILRRAISTAPKGGIIVLEDVDGLFSKERKTMNPNALTFSGLLNALDGIGSGIGQIFIMTTNFRDKLDQALIRHGRVDLQVPFTYVVPEQVMGMFKFFHEEAPEDAVKEFSDVVFETIKKHVSPEPCLTAATLQNYFITHRKCTYQEAIDQVKDLADSLISARTKDEVEKEKSKATQGEMFT